MTIALLITRCGCRQYLNSVPWQDLHEIRLPLSQEHLVSFSPVESLPDHGDLPGLDARTFEYRGSEKILGEEVLVYREKA